MLYDVVTFFPGVIRYVGNTSATCWQDVKVFTCVICHDTFLCEHECLGTTSTSFYMHKKTRQRQSVYKTALIHQQEESINIITRLMCINISIMSMDQHNRSVDGIGIGIDLTILSIGWANR